MTQVVVVNPSNTPIPVAGAARTASTVTIPNGASVSPTIDLTSTALLGFIMPAAWTVAAVSIEVSADGVNWAPTVYDSINLQTGYYGSVVAGAAYAVDSLSLLAFKYARLRSGTTAAPVNQGGDRAFTVISRSLA